MDHQEYNVWIILSSLWKVWYRTLHVMLSSTILPEKQKHSFCLIIRIWGHWPKLRQFFLVHRQLKISFSDNLGEIHVPTIVILYSRGVCVRNFKSVVFRLVKAWGPNKQVDTGRPINIAPLFTDQTVIVLDNLCILPWNTGCFFNELHF